MKYVVVSSSQLRGRAMFSLSSDFLGKEEGHLLLGSYDMDYLLNEDLDFLIFDLKYYLDYKNKIKNSKIRAKTLLLINFEKDKKQLTGINDKIKLIGADCKNRELEKIFSITKSQEKEYILGQRDKSILFLLAQGLTNKDIGKKLYLSEKTIKNNLSRIYKSLEVTNRYEAIEAFRNKNISYKKGQ
ncbi:MAG: LuxR C-terminal-related transcriptional regulator [Bacillota bacterium]|nr:LuxR C-terminal-related transcriptional regulator [Bacillota bacterium]